MRLGGRDMVPFLGLALMALLLMASCAQQRPSYVLSEEDLESALYDYHLANGILNETRGLSQEQVDRYIEAVFVKHGITKERFDTSMNWYSAYPEVMDKMYERLNSRIMSTLKTINRRIDSRKNIQKMSPQGDSVNVWPGRDMYLLYGGGFDNRVTFSVFKDNNFVDDDTLRLSLRARYMGVSDLLPNSPAVLSMGISYSKNDTALTRQILLDKKDQTVEITLQGSDLDILRSIDGYIVCPKDDEAYPLLLSDIRLMRYHKNNRR